MSTAFCPWLVHEFRILTFCVFICLHDKIFLLPSQPLRLGDGSWKAQIVKTTDGGKTWKSVFFQNNTFYFNQIACGSELSCVAIGEADTRSFPFTHILSLYHHISLVGPFLLKICGCFALHIEQRCSRRAHLDDR
jgi:hypothetical protein